MVQAVPNHFLSVSSCLRNLEVLQNFSRARREFGYISPKEAVATVKFFVVNIFAVSFLNGSGRELRYACLRFASSRPLIA